MLSPVSWWKRDTARNSFFFLNVIYGFLFSLFQTYVTNQLQTTGLVIGSGSDGGPCTVDCSVLMGTQPIELQTLLLYLTAMTLGFGGFVALNMVCFADFWKNKSLLVTGCTAIYAVFAIPAYWLTAPILSNFNSLFALSVIFGIMTNLLMGIISVYVPHCMRTAGHTDSNSAVSKGITNYGVSTAASEERRRYGFAMSSFGIAFQAGSAMLSLVIVTVLTNTVSASSAQSVGLLLTTITGFLTLVAVAGCYLGLPRLPAKPWSGTASDLVLFARSLFTRKNALCLLLSYTIYTDVTFALYTNVFQLFFVEVTPGTLETSLFSLASSILSCGSYVAYFFIQRKFRLNLEKCLLFGYTVTLIIPIWGAIGMSNQDNFGDQERWEFYVQLLIYQVAAAIVNSTWRVLYSELIPVGEEFLWFGMQIVLYCATSWINSVATGPLQTQTQNLRMPLILCVIFGLIAVAMEVSRTNLSFFEQDLLQWQTKDGQDAARARSIDGASQSEKAAKSNQEEIA